MTKKSKILKKTDGKRGDIWQEAVCRTEYVYRGQSVKNGQEVIDYLLAEVFYLLKKHKELKKEKL